MKLSVKNKLFVGFGSVLAIMALVSLSTFFGLQKIEKTEKRLLNLRLPTVIEGVELEKGINRSLAGLRGYMILGKDPQKAELFKAERARGWQDIDGAVEQMNEFATHWTDPSNVESLRKMEAFVEQFRNAQQEVEDISHSAENIPAFNLLLTEAAPRATIILAALTEMIEIESTLEATTHRKQFLKLLADSRGSFAIGLANIRAYLLSGDTQFKYNFFAKWKTNEQRFSKLNDYSFLLTPAQKDALDRYTTIRSEFAVYPEQMFALRSAKDWNRANYWLGTKAAPKAKAIMEILQQMRESQAMLKENDEALLSAELRQLELFILIGTVVGIMLGIFISVYLSRLITEPLDQVVGFAKRIASGDLSGQSIECRTHDELAVLADSINEMGAGLHQIIQEVTDSAMICQRLQFR